MKTIKQFLNCLDTQVFLFYIQSWELSRRNTQVSPWKISHCIVSVRLSAGTNPDQSIKLNKAEALWSAILGTHPIKPLLQNRGRGGTCNFIRQNGYNVTMLHTMDKKNLLSKTSLPSRRKNLPTKFWGRLRITTAQGSLFGAWLKINHPQSLVKLTQAVVVRSPGVTILPWNKNFNKQLVFKLETERRWQWKPQEHFNEFGFWGQIS